MLDFISSKRNCTGCGACYSVCPVKCISMKQDEEGFLYPFASESCINCGLCKTTCPIASPKAIESHEQKAIGYRINDYKVWKSSSSGGAFSSIVSIWGDSDTRVFGAAWEGLNVRHIDVDINNLQPLRKSKYISSETNDSFIKAKEYLEQGRKVIYSGCPCQIAGLKSFLRKDYDNLLTIDLICHGQGSKRVFDECLRDTETLIGSKVERYEFRAKRRVFETEYLSKVMTEKGSFYLCSERYTQLFLSLACVRPSCGEYCKFHKSERYGDLTIADFKKVDIVNPKTTGSKFNYSVVVSNSPKGSYIIGEMGKEKYSFYTSLDSVMDYNPNFAKQRTQALKMRDAFFKEFIVDSRKAIFKRTTPSIIMKRNIIWSLFNYLPESFRRIIIVVYRQFLKK